MFENSQVEYLLPHFKTYTIKLVLRFVRFLGKSHSLRTNVFFGINIKVSS